VFSDARKSALHEPSPRCSWGPQTPHLVSPETHMQRVLRRKDQIAGGGRNARKVRDHKTYYQRVQVLLVSVLPHGIRISFRNSPKGPQNPLLAPRGPSGPEAMRRPQSPLDRLQPMRRPTRRKLVLSLRHDEAQMRRLTVRVPRWRACCGRYGCYGRRRALIGDRSDWKQEVCADSIGRDS
jgi:hypothetical protein